MYKYQYMRILSLKNGNQFLTIYEDNVAVFFLGMQKRGRMRGCVLPYYKYCGKDENISKN